MGALTIGFLSTFLELGITMLVIREHQPSREHYDTAWTISLLQGIFLSGLLLAFAPLADIFELLVAHFFGGRILAS